MDSVSGLNFDELLVSMREDNKVPPPLFTPD